MIRLILLATVVIVLVTGCGGPKRPDGFPALYSCSVTVTQGNAPLEGVNVTLRNPEISGKWSISGMTDASGVAKIRTHGQFPGAPMGTFKVVLSKSVSEGGSRGDDMGAPPSKEPTRIYSLIDKQYLQEETTPLQIDVQKKGASPSFDIGAPVRILLETIEPGGV